MRLQNTLRQKILLPLLVLWLLSLLVMVVWSVEDFDSRLHHRVKDRAELIGNTVNYAADTVTASGELRRMVSALGSEPDVANIVVIAGEPPRVLLSTAAQWQGKLIRDLKVVNIQQAQQTAQRFGSSYEAFTDGYKMYWFALPLLLSQSGLTGTDLQHGTVVVQIDTARMREDLQLRITQWLAGMVLFSTGIALTMLLLLRKHVLRPLESTVKVLEQYASGDNTVRVAVADREQDELTNMMRTLNQTLDAREQEESARLRTEGNLRRNAMFQQAVLSSAGVAIISTDTSGVIQLFNPLAEKMLGYTAEEFVGWLTPAEFHDLDEVAARAAVLTEELGETIAPGFDAFVAKARITGQPDANEWTYIRKNGSRLPVNLTVTCLNDDAGNILGYLGVAQDISDVKLAEERLHRVIEATSSGILMADKAGEILLVNRQTETLFGYASGELVGQKLDVLLPINLREQHRRQRKLYMAEPEARNMGGNRDLKAMRKDGSFFDVEIGLMPIESDDGLQIICTIADITLRKERESELKEARRAAELAVRAKSEFLAVMSHEICTPMNGVMGMAQLLTKTSLSMQQREYVRVIERSGDALLTVINDVLDFSKLEAGKVDLEHRPFDMQEEIGATVQLLENRASEKGIQLLQEFSAICPQYVVGDSHRLRQILLNLVSNAIKFTERGHVVIQVTGEAQGECAALRIHVRDTGKGIAHDRQLRLFKAFSQADSSTTREYGGTGLGLAICQRLVEEMGGQIGVDSLEGVGSNFWFSCALPLANAEDVAHVQQREHRSTQQQFSGTVLLAEDTDINRMVVEAMLESTGVKIVCAENGREALAILAEQKIDLVLMDCLMPDMDGYEATSRLRALEKNSGHHVPVIALTANAMQEAREECLAAGMDDFLSKPFMEAELLEKMGRYLPVDNVGEDLPNIGDEKSVPAQVGKIANTEHTPNNMRLQALVQRLGAERVQQLIALFEANAHALLREWQAAETMADVVSLQRVVHSLKAAAGTFGLEKLEHIAERYEKAFRDNRSASFFNGYAVLSGALSEGLTALCRQYSEMTRRDADNLPVMIARSNKVPAAARCAGGRILYVEDDVSQAEVIKAFLQDAEYDVIHVLHADDAIACFRQREFDLVITDMMLGDSHGSDVVKGIRQFQDAQKNTIPILAMSGFEDREEIAGLFYEGIDDFVDKPVIAEEFLSRVSNLVEKRKTIMQLKEQSEKMEAMAMHDQLTGLYNRHYLMNAAVQHISRAHRQHSALSMIVMDIDHFKEVNDKLGHQMGDKVLKHIADVFDAHLRQEDIAARYGGEEFVVLMHCGLEAAQRKANQLREAVMVLQPAGVDVTASFGVAQLHEEQDSFDLLFQRADQAVYEAKNDGRNCVRMLP